jgi:hypothetical protein
MSPPRRSIDRLPEPLRCPWCGSGFTSRSRGREAWFCHSCWRVFREVAEVGYDFVADGWSAALGKLQADGELIAVRLPHGFVGVCMISVEGVPRRRKHTRREVVSR